MKITHIAHISGHISLSRNDFEKNYCSKIDIGIKHNHFFLIGDAMGTDSFAQEYIHTKYPSFRDVIVCHMFDTPRNNIGNFKTIGGFQSDVERDMYMTIKSNYDIVYIAPKKENSGTAQNVKRRNILNQASIKFNEVWCNG